MFVNVVGGDARLRLSNYSGKTIVIRGYQGEPYLRFDKSGVFQNMRSPATYRNRVAVPIGGRSRRRRSQGRAPLEARCSGASFAWSDHRIHWTSKDAPPGVQKQPQKIQLVFRWRVPGTAGGNALRDHRRPRLPPATAGTRRPRLAHSRRRGRRKPACPVRAVGDPPPNAAGRLARLPTETEPTSDSSAPWPRSSPCS